MTRILWTLCLALVALATVVPVAMAQDDSASDEYSGSAPCAEGDGCEDPVRNVPAPGPGNPGPSSGSPEGASSGDGKGGGVFDRLFNRDSGAGDDLSTAGGSAGRLNRLDGSAPLGVDGLPRPDAPPASTPDDDGVLTTVAGAVTDSGGLLLLLLALSTLTGAGLLAASRRRRRDGLVRE